MEWEEFERVLGMIMSDLGRVDDTMVLIAANVDKFAMAMRPHHLAISFNIRFRTLDVVFG